ncbi:MAG: uncharacterized protein KVP18_003294 [Porospora cf. gigantea A]|uniref:uncharacterized protein n=1 Tax=Porospora cf. gigantea A TaxID=2853593 RepID=UPI0035596E6B|nr:MAG: hypothetical protein KVP18_003294 [Porospora cf. gigantea A]
MISPGKAVIKTGSLVQTGYESSVVLRGIARWGDQPPRDEQDPTTLTVSPQAVTHDSCMPPPLVPHTKEYEYLHLSVHGGY